MIVLTEELPLRSWINKGDPQSSTGTPACVGGCHRQERLCYLIK